jgi:hypothetical protein
MKTIKITDEVLAVLSACTVTDLKMGALITINTGTLDRKTYTKVNQVLEEIGGT